MTYVSPLAFQNPKRILKVSKHSVASFTTILSALPVNITSTGSSAILISYDLKTKSLI